MSSPFVNPFARKSKIGYPESVARLKEEARRHLDLTEEVTISVTELNCSDEGCPDTETVVAVLISGEKPRLARVHKPIPEVTLQDLVKAFGGETDLGS